MKEQLTKEEIAKVKHLYYGNCLCEVTEKFYFKKIPWNKWEIVRSTICGYDFFVYGICLKPILKPLSEISDEDAIEVAKLSLFEGEPEVYARVGKDIIERVINYKNYTHRRMVFCPEQYLFLISQGYAVPLFFAPNHWANGKTAIELGIAIPEMTSHNQQ